MVSLSNEKINIVARLAGKSIGRVTITTWMSLFNHATSQVTTENTIGTLLYAILTLKAVTELHHDNTLISVRAAHIHPPPYLMW